MVKKQEKPSARPRLLPYVVLKGAIEISNKLTLWIEANVATDHWVLTCDNHLSWWITDKSYLCKICQLTNFLHTKGTHLLYIQRVHTCSTYKGYTLALHTKGTHLLYIQRVHTCFTYKGYTLALHTKGTHMLCIQRVHTCSIHKVYILALLTKGTHLIYIQRVHTCSTYKGYTLALHTKGTHLLYT